MTRVEGGSRDFDGKFTKKEPEDLAVSECEGGMQRPTLPLLTAFSCCFSRWPRDAGSGQRWTANSFAGIVDHLKKACDTISWDPVCSASPFLFLSPSPARLTPVLSPSSSPLHLRQTRGEREREKVSAGKMLCRRFTLPHSLCRPSSS